VHHGHAISTSLPRFRRAPRTACSLSGEPMRIRRGPCAIACPVHSTLVESCQYQAAQSSASSNTTWKGAHFGYLNTRSHQIGHVGGHRRRGQPAYVPRHPLCGRAGWRPALEAAPASSALAGCAPGRSIWPASHATPSLWRHELSLGRGQRGLPLPQCLDRRGFA